MNNNTRAQTATDLIHFIQNSATWSQTTRADYVRAVRRLPKLTGHTRLEDVVIDLDDLQARFPLDGFDPAYFATRDAFKAWRRKTLAATKAFFGQRWSGRYDDQWSVLTQAVEMFMHDHADFRATSALKLTSIAAAGRKLGVAPKDLNSAALLRFCENVPAQNYKSLCAGATLLNDLQKAAPSLRTMLPAAQLKLPDRATSLKLPAPPAHLMRELDTWIAELCAAEIDEITSDLIDGKSQSTIAVYRAAGKKYLGFATSLGLLDNVQSLAAALDDNIAKQTLLVMLTDRDSQASVSLRTTRRYVENLLRLARSQGCEAPVLARALKANKELKKGRQAGRQMSPKSKKFCARLIKDRSTQLIYYSFHLRMRKLHDAMVIKSKSGERIPYLAERLKHLAMLAAMSAIWVWGPPLRIENMCALRLYGDAPQIWMPKTKGEDIKITIEQYKTKNKRAIEQRIRHGRHQAIETVNWYVNEIRPSILCNSDPIYLFPSTTTVGHHVGTGSVRDWLDNYSAKIGLPIKPHLFRHAAASLYIKSHPGAYDHVAQLLDDSPQVVRRYYAWIDELAVLDQVQANILRNAGLDHV